MRTKIALRNLYISQALIILFIIFAYFIWFPHPFSELGGFKKTAFMLIIVDLVLGPLLVFIVYKEDKKHLTFDINILLAIQILAFAFGANSLYEKRPAYAAFVHNQFKLVNASYANPQQIQFKILNSSFFSQPKLAFAKAPEDLQGLLQYIVDVNSQNKKQVDNLAKYYEPYEDHISNVLSKKLNPNIIFAKNDSKKLLSDFIKQYGGNIEDYAFFPLRGSNQKNVIFVLNGKTAQPVGIINLDLWSKRLKAS